MFDSIFPLVFGEYIPFFSEISFSVLGMVFSVSGGVSQMPFDVNFSGSFPIVDWPWLVGVFLFVLTLVSVFKLIGGVLGGR